MFLWYMQISNNVFMVHIEISKHIYAYVYVYICISYKFSTVTSSPLEKIFVQQIYIQRYSRYDKSDIYIIYISRNIATSIMIFLFQFFFAIVLRHIWYVLFLNINIIFVFFVFHFQETFLKLGRNFKDNKIKFIIFYFLFSFPVFFKKKKINRSIVLFYL